jgi:hypothetical protein
MNDRFPYDMPSRAALVRLAQEEMPMEGIEEDYVNFDDMFFAPLPAVPGRTFIEMTNRKTGRKFPYVYRRLDLQLTPIGRDAIIRVTGLPTPATIAKEINRSRNMHFGPDDLSFSNVVINSRDTSFKYTLKALMGSYAYYGEVEITVEVLDVNGWARYLEDGDPRLMETGDIREMEHVV